MIKPDDEESFNKILKRSILADDFYHDEKEDLKIEDKKKNDKSNDKMSKFLSQYHDPNDSKPRKPQELSYKGLIKYAMSNPREKIIKTALQLKELHKKSWP